MNKNTWLRISIAMLMFPGKAALAQSAANYPVKPIRYIVGYAPGGTADMLAPAVRQKLAETRGQQVIIDNRPGAGTYIGSEGAAKSLPEDFRAIFRLDLDKWGRPSRFPERRWPE